MQTAGEANTLKATADRNQLNGNEDLSFITVEVLDAKGITVPEASNMIEFSIEGPGEIVATDNGNPADLVAFGSPKRAAFSGLALVIIRSKKGASGNIKVTASSPGLKTVHVDITRK